MVVEHRIPQKRSGGKWARNGRAVLFLFVLIAPSVGASDVAASAADHWNLFSGSQEARLGRELGDWVETRAPPVHHEALQKLLDSVGNRLAGEDRPQMPTPEFHLFAASEPYALAVPGIDIYLSTGMVAALDNEAELAGLLAHELAHTALRQLTRKLSRAKRFQIRAAMVAADQGRSTLLEALVAIGTAVVPGAPAMAYTEAEESEALEFASRLLAGAGYDPTAHEQLLQRLRQLPEPVGARYLERHPPVPTDATEAGTERRQTEVSKRAFRRLTGDAETLADGSAQLDLLLEWSPPATKPQPARTRELFINRSYVFSYPATWRPGQPGFNETIEVAPKGGILERAGEAGQLVIGVRAGTLEPIEGSLTAAPTLRRDLDSLRPGLEPAARAPAGIGPVRDLETAFYSGASPAGGEELVWLIGARLPEAVFYMMLIVPAEDFERYRTEFQEIAQSIDFPGYPRSGHAEDPAAAGDKSRPETQEESQDE